MCYNRELVLFRKEMIEDSMIIRRSIFVFLLISCVKSQLSIYDDVPGLESSPYYQVQVRETGTDQWLSPFTLLTECTADKFCATAGEGIFDHLQNWSNSYVNIELEAGTEVEIKIIKLFGDDPVSKAVVRPETVGEAVIEDGDVIVKISEPCLFTVDINGQMDDQDTGKLPHSRGYYDGPPIHTVTIFVNPFISKPSVDDPGVVTVNPGDEVPSEGDWSTLYFLPGLHDVGLDFTVHSNRSYYIPGDAVVYGTFSNDDWDDGKNIHIFGHGTISGDKTPHPLNTSYPESEHWRFRPVSIQSKSLMLDTSLLILILQMHRTHQLKESP